MSKPKIAAGYYDDSDMARMMAMSPGGNISLKLEDFGIRPKYRLLIGRGHTTRIMRLYTKAQATRACRARRLELNQRGVDAFLKGRVTA